MVEQDPRVPPVGEEIHLPGNSVLPLLCALGITLALLGLTAGVPYLVAGLLLFVVVTIRWIRDARREISELPEHHSH